MPRQRHQKKSVNRDARLFWAASEVRAFASRERVWPRQAGWCLNAQPIGERVMSTEAAEPLVSVIMPTFNQRNCCALHPDVLAANLPQPRIDRVDDCFTDNTREIVREFDDSRLLVIRRR